MEKLMEKFHDGPKNLYIISNRN